jgi:hypothetical protein
MKEVFRASIVIFLLGFSGCASTELRFTSEPSGANVSQRKPQLGYPFFRDNQYHWLPRGTTPCKIVVYNDNGPFVARVSISTNQSRIIEVKQQTQFINSCFGPYILAGGLPAGIMAGAMSGSPAGLAAGVLLGAGMSFFGFEMCNHASYYPQTNFHVDFRSVDGKGAGD